jgi:hypothetical protein
MSGYMIRGHIKNVYGYMDGVGYRCISDIKVYMGNRCIWDVDVSMLRGSQIRRSRAGFASFSQGQGEFRVRNSGARKNVDKIATFSRRVKPEGPGLEVPQRGLIGCRRCHK